MATKAMIAKNERRKALVAKYADQRGQLKKLIAHPGTAPDVRQAAVSALSKLPRDSSATRVRNRDSVDGRPRGHLRKFGLSRVRLRAMAHAGELPGVSKSSW
ncbi:30S ribosomal protein S14 [Tsukamurella sp. 8F]|uniref:30S ribosomal protein S14 n=1 Tax=unclassified Tsukamurella TaxID=2633480 RepID=UPI0023B9F7F2|nr:MULTISPECIES: 30S ribosomal protein S14 [unclassified Tsukamurella]MDF0532515.1 30S ribosomal protein S14 [Tsukamurella sp. 8J]MDF0589401.1 30S ribosomal protein S14 [Tsukamurella sp. 8F]